MRPLTHVFWAVLAVLALLAGGICLHLYREWNDYTQILALNWELTLPSYEKEIYTTDSGQSFHGDGERYHVFRYGADSPISTAVSWQSGEDAAVVSGTEAILNTLDVPEEHRPDFAHCQWFTKPHPSDTRNKLYLLWDSGTRELYVAELFL